MARLQWVTFLAVALILFLALNPMSVRSADLGVREEPAWPREIKAPEATILIYQPQLEKFEENRMESRFAASVQTPNMAEPVFGAVWTKARVETDRDARIVRLVSLETVRSRFPNATPEQEAAFAAILKKQVPAWDLPLSLRPAPGRPRGGAAASDRGRGSGEPTARHYPCRPPGDPRHCRRRADSQAHREFNPDGGGQYPFPHGFQTRRTNPITSWAMTPGTGQQPSPINGRRLPIRRRRSCRSGRKPRIRKILQKLIPTCESSAPPNPPSSSLRTDRPG
jgi:hypothetical protein